MHIHIHFYAAVAWHPVHPLLVSGGSEGSILHWDLSTPDENSTFNQSVSPPRATLSQAHDSNVWSLAYHPFGHILASASNDHTTRFWSRERPGDVSSVFSGGGEKPPEIIDTAGQDEEDDAMVPGFGFGFGGGSGAGAGNGAGGAGGGGGGGAWWGKDEDVGASASDALRRGASDHQSADDFIPGFGTGAGDGPSRQNAFSSMHQQSQDTYGGPTEKDEFGRDRDYGGRSSGGGDHEGWGSRGGGGGGGGSYNRGSRYGPRRGGRY